MTSSKLMCKWWHWFFTKTYVEAIYILGGLHTRKRIKHCFVCNKTTEIESKLGGWDESNRSR